MVTEVRGLVVKHLTANPLSSPPEALDRASVDIEPGQVQVDAEMAAEGE
jgi:hypothetical protein